MVIKLKKKLFKTDNIQKYFFLNSEFYIKRYKFNNIRRR